MPENINVRFKKGEWEDKLEYAYTSRYKETPQFVQAEDCVLNRVSESNNYGYENVTLVTKEKYGEGATVSAECSFDKMGAPLILITDGLYKDESGNLLFGDYYEIVLYEDGINVWQMFMEDKTVKWNKLLGVFFKVSEKEKKEFSVKLLKQAIEILCGEEKMWLRIPDLPEKANLGITACEGINRFYSFSVGYDEQ